MILRINIRNGINLNIKKSEKFKTIKIYIDFMAPVNVNETSMRVLLAQILETSSEKYPTQTALAEQLSWMYGASFGASVFRYGNQQGIRFTFNLVNGKYLGLSNEKQAELIKSAFQFLNEVIFHPLLGDEAFDQETFIRQKENVIDYLNSALDDKQQLAAIELRKLYYANDLAFANGVLGSVDLMQEVSNSKLFAYYKNTLNHNLVNISVLGDVDVDVIKKLVLKLPFDERNSEKLSSPFNHHQDFSLVKRNELDQPVSQSKLNFAFSFPVYWSEKDYFAALVFNELLGASPISMLFSNVREKESLAYYAQSVYSPYTGLLVVETGINSQDAPHVEELVLQQIRDINQGKFTKDQFDRVISKIISDRQIADDNQQALMGAMILKELFGRELTNEEWVANIEHVSKDAVMTIASKVKLQAVFFLKGA